MQHRINASVQDDGLDYATMGSRRKYGEQKSSFPVSSGSMHNPEDLGKPRAPASISFVIISAM